MACEQVRKNKHSSNHLNLDAITSSPQLVYVSQSVILDPHVSELTSSAVLLVSSGSKIKRPGGSVDRKQTFSYFSLNILQANNKTCLTGSSCRMSYESTQLEDGLGCSVDANHSRNLVLSLQARFGPRRCRVLRDIDRPPKR